MKVTIDKSPYLWKRHYMGSIEVDGVETNFAIDTRETEQTGEEVVNIEWENYPLQIGEERKAMEKEIIETWTEQHYAHYKRESDENTAK